MDVDKHPIVRFWIWRGSKLHNFSFLDYCRNPFGKRQALLECIFQIICYYQGIFLESFVDIMCESGCEFACGFSCCVTQWFCRSMFLLLRSRASFLATILSIGLPLVFCTTRIQFWLSLQWSLSGFGSGFIQISGRPVFNGLSLYNVKHSLLSYSNIVCLRL